jgi:hypothetical protein
MAQYTGTDELDGLFKTVYGDKGPIDLIPEVGELYKSVKLRNSEKIGANYVMTVIVANSHGFTYNTTSHTAFALNNHIAMTTQDATIPGTELVLRDAIGYRAASRSAGGKVQAFKDATDLVVKNMQDSHVKRLELMMWYGGLGIGASSSSANVDTTHTAITMTDASWASGIWSGLENAQIAFYKVSDDTLVSSSTDAIFTVQKVNDNFEDHHRHWNDHRYFCVGYCYPRRILQRVLLLRSRRRNGRRAQNLECKCIPIRNRSQRLRTLESEFLRLR